MSFLQSVTDFYLGLPGVIQWLLAIAWPIVFYYGYDYWRYSRSDMRSTMVFSLNKLMVVDHQRAYLQFYTLSYVENFRSFLPNRYLRFRFNQAIDQTNETDPIIRLDAKYGNLIYPSMFNLMSSQFGDGFLKMPDNPDRSLLAEHEYLLIPTFERFSSLRTRKTRVMVLKPYLLEQLDRLSDEQIELEKPYHAARLKTLRAIAEDYKQDPDQFQRIVLYSN